MVPMRFVLFLLASLCTFFTAVTSSQNRADLRPRDGTTCPQGGNRDITAPKENIWTSISFNDRAELTNYINKWADQNVLRMAGSAVTLEYIDLIYPNKSDALSYLQDDGPLPPRYASFNLFFAEDRNSYTRQKFSIGPLPLSANTTTIHPMDWDATSSTGGKAVQQTAYGLNATDLLRSIAPDMRDIIEDLVGPNVDASGASNIKQAADGVWVRVVHSWLHGHILTLFSLASVPKTGKIMTLAIFYHRVSTSK